MFCAEVSIRRSETSYTADTGRAENSCDVWHCHDSEISFFDQVRLGTLGYETTWSTQ